MTDSLAIVTGAARGIGRAIADEVEQAGWEVLRLDLAFGSPAPNQLIGDVTDFPALQALVARVEAEHGAIAAVVNNAGITRDSMFHKMDPRTHWDPVIAVNLTGPFNLCRAVVPGMRERRFGRIVNISSMNALKGQPGQANYAAAKAGLVAMTKTIAQEVARHGITANCIAPGFIDTDMTAAIQPGIRAGELAKVPVGRAGRPQEVAKLVAYLLSDAAAFITGETISITGGQVMT